jgi:lysophospholipase L1-like esterase
VPARTVSTVLWVGDSVAGDEAPAVVAALQSAGATVVNGAFEARQLIASDGVNPAELYPPLVAAAHADLVVVQLSFWDSAFPLEQQRSAFAWFHDLVRATGAELVFVTPPPIRADLADPGLLRQIMVAGELVAADPGTHLLDSVAAWGPELDADIGDDGAPDRKPDGVHVCPQGAARLAAWLVTQLAGMYAGLTPAPPEAWASGPWLTDRHYDTPVGACAALDAGSG